MKLALTHFRLPAIISLALVLPFAILELINRRSHQEDFPTLLFATLWLLSTAFILILMPVVHKVQTGTRTTRNALSILAGIAILMLVAWLWVGIMLDQMPCFLGVPRCD